MKIIEYFRSEKKEYWLEQIGKSNWDAGQFLYQLLSENTLQNYVGKDAKVLLLVEGDHLVSFCTFAEKDDIQPTDLTPWIGWVYTFPEYRGKHCAGELLSYAEELAKEEKDSNIYISTNHIGLYEKYGYEFFQVMKDISGEDSRVYTKNL